MLRHTEFYPLGIKHGWKTLTHIPIYRWFSRLQWYIPDMYARYWPVSTITIYIYIFTIYLPTICLAAICHIYYKFGYWYIQTYIYIIYVHVCPDTITIQVFISSKYCTPNMPSSRHAYTYVHVLLYLLQLRIFRRYLYTTLFFLLHL